MQGSGALDFIKQSLGMLLLFPILDYPESGFFRPVA